MQHTSLGTYAPSRWQLPGERRRCEQSQDRRAPGHTARATSLVPGEAQGGGPSLSGRGPGWRSEGGLAHAALGGVAALDAAPAHGGQQGRRRALGDIDPRSSGRRPWRARPPGPRRRRRPSASLSAMTRSSAGRRATAAHHPLAPWPRAGRRPAGRHPARPGCAVADRVVEEVPDTAGRAGAARRRRPPPSHRSGAARWRWPAARPARAGGWASAVRPGAGPQHGPRRAGGGADRRGYTPAMPHPVAQGASPCSRHPSPSGSARTSGGPGRRRWANAVPPTTSPDSSRSSQRARRPSFSHAPRSRTGPSCWAHTKYVAPHAPKDPVHLPPPGRLEPRGDPKGPGLGQCLEVPRRHPLGDIGLLRRREQHLLRDGATRSTRLPTPPTVSGSATQPRSRLERPPGGGLRPPDNSGAASAAAGGGRRGGAEPLPRLQLLPLVEDDCFDLFVAQLSGEAGHAAGGHPAAGVVGLAELGLRAGLDPVDVVLLLGKDSSDSPSDSLGPTPPSPPPPWQPEQPEDR